MVKAWTRWFLIGFIVIVLLIQLVPYGHDHTNPPVNVEPVWDDPRTRELTLRACFDCHSNLTIWPWYSNIAPISWLIQRDVKKGRRELNFSESNKSQEEAQESANTIARAPCHPGTTHGPDFRTPSGRTLFEVWSEHSGPEPGKNTADEKKDDQAMA